MAIIEQDREDLFRDGRAMPVRGETIVDGVAWLIGFRPSSQASFYGGADLVFQFNEAGELRRSFVAGQRFVARQGVLSSIESHTRGQRLRLSEVPLSPLQSESLQRQLTGCLTRLRCLASDPTVAWRTIGRNEQSFRDQVLRWLDLVTASPQIANGPQIVKGSGGSQT